MSIQIGSHVYRVRGQSGMLTLVHLVDSLVADAVLTRCGRRMKRKNSHGSLTDLDALYGLENEQCRQCYP